MLFRVLSLMLLPEGLPYGDNGVLVFADCAVVPDPLPKNLLRLQCAQPRLLATLPTSLPKWPCCRSLPKGSAKHERVDKVIRATELALARFPLASSTANFQADAALVPSVAHKKTPDGLLSGQANVLVFPSLEVGNIA